MKTEAAGRTSSRAFIELTTFLLLWSSASKVWRKESWKLSLSARNVNSGPVVSDVISRFRENTVLLV